MREKKELIQGIGHKIKSVENPDARVVIIKEFVRKHFKSTEVGRLSWFFARSSRVLPRFAVVSSAATVSDIALLPSVCFLTSLLRFGFSCSCSFPFSLSLPPPLPDRSLTTLWKWKRSQPKRSPL
jgi:hypothetical protein